MKIKKTILVVAGLWIAAQTACASPASMAEKAVVVEKMVKKPVGLFPEIILFTADPGMPKFCELPTLKLTLNRDHPRRESRLDLPSDSPYEKAIIIHSDPFDPNAKIRKYTDQVTLKHGEAVIILNGTGDHNKMTNSGFWSDNRGCRGSFVVHLHQ